jgi:ribosome-associated protein
MGSPPTSGSEPSQRSDGEGLVVSEDLVIPERELHYRFARSGGPGGQNVNKVNTSVTLLFSPRGSSVLGPDQIALIEARLATRINSDGVMRVVSKRSRSQSFNRQVARERLSRLLADALHESPERLDTVPGAGAVERRLEGKKRKGRVKRERSQDWSEE